ncbi:MAG: hypothetical protein LCH56_04520 [Proteobacteria bacterium]|nr:hypothetical protein [Pseudomonadota bacterium]
MAINTATGGPPPTQPRQGRPGSKVNAIELRLDAIDQLFSSLDPFPFRNRDLDKDAEEFIVDWARELKENEQLAIVIHLPRAVCEGANSSEIEDAIRRYFQYRADLIGSDLKQLFRTGRRALAIGLLMLGLCLALERLIEMWNASTEAARFVREGLVILGWVANWRPMEIFLYDWWPLAKRRALYRRLGMAHVTLQPAP